MGCGSWETINGKVFAGRFGRLLLFFWLILSMEGTRKRDEQNIDATSQSTSPSDESQGTELAGHAAEGEPCIDRLDISDTGAVEDGMSRTVEEATVDLDDSAVRDDRGGRTDIESQWDYSQKPKGLATQMS